MNKQNLIARNILSKANILFNLLLDPDDKLSFYSARKLVRTSTFVKNSLTKYLSENTAAGLIFMAVNMGIITYQYLYASWFLYLITTISGVKKLYKVIFKNPILGIFFFSSFYFKLLSSSDKDKFNYITKKFKLPSHEDVNSSKFLTSLVNNIPDKFDAEISGYKIPTKSTLKTISSVMISKKIEDLGPALFYSIKNPKSEVNKNHISDSAVCLTKYDIIDQADLREWGEYVKKNKKKIKNEIKKQKIPKGKRKLELQRVIERKTKTGEVVCLGDCKSRTKTAMGCYCEGDCGTTFFWGNQEWCYVDPDKCKKGRYLASYGGKKWDKCNSKKRTTSKCYTGWRWVDCKK